MRGVLKPLIFALAVMLATSTLSQAQTSEASALDETAPAPSLFEASSLRAFDSAAVFGQQPAPAPPTPRHTGIKALTQHLFTNFKYLPSRENLLWAGGGGGLALAAHPFDDNVNEWFLNNPNAEHFFKPGEVLGELYTLLPTASAIYAVGRIKDQPKVSHLGMDLIESLAMSEALTQALKYSTRRERPDGSGKTSFPSGHAADTFAFATALERHLNWRFSIPAYVFSSYVAISRLPANRHWLSDTVFGAAVGIIAGRTVTSHEAERPYPVAVTVIPGGVAVMYMRDK
jgi:membrane-associated phospholipid phosphatase